MNDLIYRQDALDKAYRLDLSDTGNALVLNVIDVDVIKALPPAQPERKKGRWVLHTYMPHVAYCTICERNSPYNRRWDFCPNCGADMRIGENGKIN